MKSFLVSLALVLAACSGGFGTTSLAHADPAHPVRIFHPTSADDTVVKQSKAATTALAVVSKIFDLRKPNQGVLPLSRLSAGALDAGAGTDPSQLATSLNAVLDPADCTFEIPVDQPGGGGSDSGNGVDMNIKSLHLEIKGDKCPLTAVIDVNVTSPSNSANLTGVVTMQVEAHSDQVQGDLDLKTFTLKGNFSTHVEQTAQGSTFGLSLDLKGNGETVKEGVFSADVAFVMNGVFNNPPQGSTNTDPSTLINITFNEDENFAAAGQSIDLSSTMHMKGFNVTAHYFVDKKEVTQAVFEQYQTDFNIPGFTPGGGQTPPPVDTNPMQCSLQVFDAKLVPTATLQKYLQGQATLPAPLQQLSACGKNGALSFTYQGQVGQLSIQYQAQFVEAIVTRGTTPFPIYAQNDANSSAVGQDGDVTHLFVCQPIMACPQ